MGRQRRKSLVVSASPTAVSAPAPASEDLEALEAFCRAVPLEEVSFEEFCAAHRRLNICVLLPVSAQNCQQGWCQQVSYHRVVKAVRRVMMAGCESVERQEAWSREAMQVQVRLPAGSQWDDEIVMVGLGDQGENGEYGDLVVKLRPSPRKKEESQRGQKGPEGE